MSIPSGRELGHSPLFNHVQASDLDTIAREMQEQSYGNRELIFEEGHSFSGLYLVKKGEVKLLRASKDKEQLIAIAIAGEPLDPVPLLDSGPHSLTARARGPVVLYFIPAEKAHDLVWNTPPLFSALLNYVSSQLRGLATLATDLAFKDVTARVCKVLLDQVQRSGEVCGDGIHLKRSLSQNEMAAFAGTSREVAWRSLKKLEEEHIIRIDRHEITVLALERLAALA